MGANTIKKGEIAKHRERERCDRHGDKLVDTLGACPWPDEAADEEGDRGTAAAAAPLSLSSTPPWSPSPEEREEGEEGDEEEEEGALPPSLWRIRDIAADELLPTKYTLLPAIHACQQTNRKTAHKRKLRHVSQRNRNKTILFQKTEKCQEEENWIGEMQDLVKETSKTKKKLTSFWLLRHFCVKVAETFPKKSFSLLNSVLEAAIK